MDRPLTPEEDAALRWILWLEDFPGADDLRAQIEYVRAISGRVTELDLQVIGAAPAAVNDGILDVAALVVGEDDEPEGVINIWVEGGYLSTLEYSWFTDRMPTEYPSPDHLRRWDPWTG